MKKFLHLILALLLLSAPLPAFAQTVPSYVEAATGNTKAGIGVSILDGANGTAVDNTTITGTAVANGNIIGPLDTAGYQSAAFIVTNTGGGGTFVVENSVDNVTWQGSFFISAQGMSSQQITTSTGSVNINYAFPIISRYIRIRMSSYVSGTASVTINLRKIPLQGQAIQIAGVSTLNSGADAVNNSQTGLPFYARTNLYNGATWDRQTNIVGALAAGSTGLGTTAVEQEGTPFAEITTGTTTLVKTGAAYLYTVNVNTCVAAATVKIYNALTATGTPITITCGATVAALPTMTYDAYFGTGITVVTSGATDVTIGYR